MWFTTVRVVLVSGAADGGTRLNAFDNALEEAGIAEFNLVRVSSIVPPSIPVVHIAGMKSVIRGQGMIVPVVYEEAASNCRGTEIAAAVGVGIPVTSSPAAGLIFTCTHTGVASEAEVLVRQMIAEGMSKRGIAEFVCKVASSSRQVDGKWSCAIAAAVFCDAEIAAIVDRTRESESVV